MGWGGVKLGLGALLVLWCPFASLACRQSEGVAGLFSALCALRAVPVSPSFPLSCVDSSPLIPQYLTRRIPQNPRYQHIKTRLDTGEWHRQRA